MSAGLVNKWFDEEYRRLEHEQALQERNKVDKNGNVETDAHSPDANSDVNRAFKLQDLEGVFYIWAVGLGISSCAFIIELVYIKKPKYRQ